MDWIWGGMLLISLLMGIMTGSGAAVADAALAGAGEAVTLCVTLLGAYMLWMGLMNVAKEAGMIDALSSALKPLMGKLFPASKEAAAAITLNLCANFFGMGSAATPFGLEAMAQMQKTNPKADQATDDMCLFLCLNASAVELLPTQVLSLRAAWRSMDVYAIVAPTFLASLVCAFVAVALCLLFRRLRHRRRRG